MNLTVTAALAALCIACAVFCGWRAAQPAPIGKGPRMVPWRFLMIVSIGLLLYLGVHLMALAGISNGGGARFR